MNEETITLKKNLWDTISRTGIHVEHSKITEDFPLHNHEFNETFIILSGTANHILGGQIYPLHRGDVFAIKGDVAHGFHQVNNLELINLMYDPELFSKPDSDLQQIPGFVPLFLIEPEIRAEFSCSPQLKIKDDTISYVASMTNFLIHLENKKDSSLSPVIRLNFMGLISYLAVQYDATVKKAVQPVVLANAVRYIHSHITEQIQISDIAAGVYLSPRQLERLFQKFYRESPIRYLRRMRLKKAADLLIHSTQPVKEIAWSVGIEDVSYFIRLFSEMYGQSPQKWRQQMKYPSQTLNSSAG